MEDVKAYPDYLEPNENMYSIIFKLSHADKESPSAFQVADKVSLTKDIWRFGMQVTLDHMKSLNSSICSLSIGPIRRTQTRA